MRRIGNGISWALALLLLVWVAALFGSDWISGLTSLLGVALIVPPIGSALGQKWHLTGRVKQVAVGVALAVVGGPIVGAVIGGFTVPSGATGVAVSQPEMEARKVAAVKIKQEADKAKQEAEWLKQRDAADRQRKKDCSDTLTAFVMSQKFVKKSLRSPSTANFPYITTSGVRSVVSGDCRFTVSAFVDAQNAYGATVRTNYLIDMEYLPEQKTWRASNLQM